MILPETPDLTGLAGFGSLDVAANELGSLSAPQRSVLRRRILTDFAKVAVVGAFVVVVVMSGGGLVAVLGGFVLTYAGYRLITFATSVRRGRVCFIQGDASLQLVPDSEGPDQYHLLIESMKLDLTKEMYLQMRDGGPYRVFYLEGTRHVVSAAPMPGWRPLSPPPAKRRRRWNIDIGL